MLSWISPDDWGSFAYGMVAGLVVLFMVVVFSGVCLAVYLALETRVDRKKKSEEDRLRFGSQNGIMIAETTSAPVELNRS